MQYWSCLIMHISCTCDRRNNNHLYCLQTTAVTVARHIWTTLSSQHYKMTWEPPTPESVIQQLCSSSEYCLVHRSLAWWNSYLKCLTNFLLFKILKNVGVDLFQTKKTRIGHTKLRASSALSPSSVLTVEKLCKEASGLPG